MSAADASQRLFSTLNRVYLVLARILIGYLWYTQTLWKPPPHFGKIGADGGLWHFLKWEVEYPTFQWYKWFVEAVVMPHYTLFGYQVYFLELAIAVSLGFGVLTRLGALAGTLMALNLLIGLYSVPYEWAWSYAMLALLCAGLLCGGAGRIAGIDALLLPRLRAAAPRHRLARLLLWCM
ncbi:MAG: DoxX family membrane protein [Deltaproteobacteria bacterium]|nr:DoxX family membrane protein [Deltaproteobacteria bacterium]